MHVCNWQSAWPMGHPLPPVDPEKLTGPAVGAIVRYVNPAFPQWDRMLVRVVEQSYVWSPGECRAHGGYRHYDWTVIEWPVLARDGGVTFKKMVVNDENLETL
jgi:hypothetical protein